MCSTKATVLVLSIIAFSPQASAQSSRGALASGVVAFKHANVIAMTSDSVLTDVTVLVRDGRIAAVGELSAEAIPPGARVIDASGKFLIPGLADMHTHLFSDEDAPDSVAPLELGVMLANGVTTIRLMIGTPEHLALRKEIEAGRVIGPQLWVASPQFTGRADVNCRVVTTPDEARNAVKESADAGYDFIKLTLFITPEVFDAVVSEAARNGIRVVGHVDPRVGVLRAVAAGQHIEHLDNYLESALADNAPSRDSLSDRGVFRPRNWDSLDYIDDKKLAELAEATAKARVWTTPTLTIPKHAFALGQSDAELRARPDWKLQPAKHREMFLKAHARYWQNPPAESRRHKYVEIRNRIVKSISDAGGKIMAGSDTPEWFFGYGYTLHRELESLVAAGLTPHQALAAATCNPAEFLHSLGDWGTIEAGKRADLVLLAANPLDDIRNTTKIAGVCVGGRWLERSELERMISNAVEKMAGEDRNPR